MTEQKKSNKEKDVVVKRTDQNASDKASDKESTTVSKKNAPDKTPKKSSHSLTLLSITLAVIAILLSLFSMGRGFLVDHSNQAMSKNVNEQLQQHQKSITDLNQQMEVSLQKLRTVSESMKTTQAQLTKSQAAMGQLQNFRFANRESWMLTSVAHLLRLAQYDLDFTGDISSTIALLKTIQTHLASSTSPRILPLRQAIANNLAELQAISKVDLAGLMVKLDAISQQIVKLPLISNKFITPNLLAGENKSKGTVSDSGFHKYWDRSLETLEKIVVIRHHSKPIAPLISPKQQANLVHTIQLKLMEAGWAALHRNEALYKVALQQSARWIHQYYITGTEATNAKITQSVLSNLNHLMKISVAPNYPNLIPTIKIANDLLNRSNQGNKKSIKKSDNVKKNSNNKKKEGAK